MKLELLSVIFFGFFIFFRMFCRVFLVNEEFMCVGFSSWLLFLRGGCGGKGRFFYLVRKGL